MSIFAIKDGHVLIPKKLRIPKMYVGSGRMPMPENGYPIKVYEALYFPLNSAGLGMYGEILENGDFSAEQCDIFKELTINAGISVHSSGNLTMHGYTEGKRWDNFVPYHDKLTFAISGDNNLSEYIHPIFDLAASLEEALAIISRETTICMDDYRIVSIEELRTCTPKDPT